MIKNIKILYMVLDNGETTESAFMSLNFYAIHIFKHLKTPLKGNIGDLILKTR